MKSSVLSFLLLIASSIAFAQKNSLSIKVIDVSSNVIPSAGIYLLNTGLAGNTNAAGFLVFNNLDTGTYLVQVAAAGYATQNRRLSVAGDKEEIVVLNPAYTQLDQVVVTAQKREELLQRLPLSVTALSARQVQQYRLWNIRDVTAISPNLYAADPGDKRNTTSIRGITTTSYDPAVATYVDGVNQFNLDTYIPLLFDVERIEVLRGPQGTLYGRNAMGGVINIITRQPSNKTGGFAEVSLGNYGLQRYSAGMRTALVKDKLFFGLAGLHERSNGFYTNEFNNSHYDEQSNSSGNYYLKYLPATNWQLTANVKHSSNRNKGAFPLVFGVEEAFANPFKLNQNAITLMRDNTMNASLSLNYSGHPFLFSSQTSYQSNYRYYTLPIDADFSPYDINTLINNYGREWNNVKAATQEFRFSSPAASTAPVNWTAGTYLFYQNNPVRQGTHIGNDTAGMGFPDANFSLINTNKAKGSGIAAYGQMTYRLTQNLGITAGLRYDYEHKEQSILGEYQKDPDPTPLFAYRTDTSSSASFAAFSPKLSLAYHPADNNTLYASYSRGFRAGGITQLSADPSAPLPLYEYEPEYSTNYEVGWKNTFTGNKLQLNVAAFYSRITNAQVPTLILPDAVTVTKNAGELSSKGIELELAATPVKGVELNYAFGYTDAEYQTLKLPGDMGEVDLKGRRQVFTPEVTSMLAAQYSYALGGKQNLQLVVRGEWRYLGTQYFDLENNIRQSPYSLLNTRFGISANKFEVMLWGRNLGDKRYISYAYNFGAVHLGDPRTYGITLMGRF